MPSVTVLQLDPLVPVDNFGPWLAEVAGLDVQIVQVWHAGVPEAVGDGVVVLGGTMDAYADSAFPHLRDVRELIRTRTAAGLPTLGICLGHQLMAVALGGAVDVGAPAGPEVGLVELQWLDDAATDPVVGEAFREGLALAASDHRDAVARLPAGARVLGESDRYVQAFRVGSAWGVQFHPEASVDLMAQWLARSGGEDSARILAALRTAEASLSALGRSLAQSFGRVVLEGDSPHVGYHR